LEKPPDCGTGLLALLKCNIYSFFAKMYFEKPSSPLKRRQIAAFLRKRRQIAAAGLLFVSQWADAYWFLSTVKFQETFARSERPLDCPTALLVWPHKVHSQS
jgi:hypothetical protein